MGQEGIVSELNWRHLDFTRPESIQWIKEQSGLPETAADALLDEDSRPRTVIFEKGILVMLRGVNMNPGSDFEDMISIRIWLEEGRIISTGRRRLKSVELVKSAIEKGEGPANSGEFITQLNDHLENFINSAIEEIENRLEQAEDQIGSVSGMTRNSPFSSLRRQTARIRRYLTPQKEALERLSRASDKWLSAHDLDLLREQSNQLTLILEDLDLVRERSIVAQEEFLGLLAHEQNSRMFLLSIVAAIFLPLSFLTGLMGMNVAGLPGLEYQWAFWILVVTMLVIAAFILLLFHIKKWF
jgi:zinc transporter